MTHDLDQLDKIGGRLLFRFIGGVLAVVVVGLAMIAGIVLYNGPTIEARLASGVLLILVFVLGRLTIWCFGDGRRLSLADPV